MEIIGYTKKKEEEKIYYYKTICNKCGAILYFDKSDILSTEDIGDGVIGIIRCLSCRNTIDTIKIQYGVLRKNKEYYRLCDGISTIDLEEYNDLKRQYDE